MISSLLRLLKRIIVCKNKHKDMAIELTKACRKVERHFECGGGN